MNRHIVGVSSSASVSSADRLMRASHVGVLPVLTNGKLVGIITRKQVDYSSQKASVKTAWIMSRPVFVTKSEETVQVIKRMVENGLPRLPVVNNEKDRLCIGIITTTDIVKELKK